MIVAIARPAAIIASGLARPSRRVSSAGMPKIPLPIMQLITSPASAQRPIERTKSKASPEQTRPRKCRRA